MDKSQVHELKTVNGKLVVYRIKAPIFNAVYNVEKENFEDTGVNESLLRKAKAFVKTELKKRGADHIKG